jgi:hypothetical protein
LNSGSQRRLVQARPCRSAMAILVGSRSRGNRGAATSQWHWNDEKLIESTLLSQHITKKQMTDAICQKYRSEKSELKTKAHKAPSSKLWNIPVFWNNREESTFIE